MNKDTQDKVQTLMRLFDKSFINRENELILVPEFNLYFRLEDVENEVDLKAKAVAWLSKYASDCNLYRQVWRNIALEKSIRDRLNTFLGIKLNSIQWRYIYTIFGNMIRKNKLDEWIKGGCDFTIFEQRKEYQDMYDLLVNERGIKVYE